MNLPTQSKRKQNRRSQREEQGYALVALVGIMMFALILTTAAAPMVQKESQREREEEMLWRGSQIARAIQAYGPLGINGKPLTDLKELVEGREQPGAAGGTKIGRVRFLRASALCDPMVPCKDGSNWRMVRANDALIKDFYDLLMAKQSSLPLGSPERMQLEIALNSLRPFIAGAVSNVPGQASSLQLGGSFNNGNSGDGQQQGDNSDSSIGPKTRPILGVSSEKNGTMFRNYYGVEEYKRALFFPGVPVQAGGFVLQAGSDGATAQAPINERCEDGSLRINGQCGFGVIKDGRCPPSKRGPDGSCIP